MERKLKIENEYYEDGMFLYKKKHVTFEPGITVLVGCNGCGKTTLIRQIKYIIEKKLKLPCVHYDNVSGGGRSSMGSAAFCNDYGFVSMMFDASEGEGIALNLQRVAGQISAMIKKHPDSAEYWVLLDGVDSGMSVDAIEDLKRGLFDTVFEHYGDKNIYIIVSANEYEMARGEKCFDTVNCKYVNIKSYERYRNVILKSREYKNERDKKLAEYIEQHKDDDDYDDD